MKASIAALLFLFATPALAWDQDAMDQHIAQTNFVLDGDCSATLVGKTPEGHGLLLTAKHCIYTQYVDVTRQIVNKKGEVEEKTIRIIRPGFARQITFQGANQVSQIDYSYKIKNTSTDHDLGLVETVGPLPNQTVAPLSCSEPKRGDVVWAVGNPFVRLYGTSSKGVVTNLSVDYRSLGLSEGRELLEGLDISPDAGLILHTAQSSPGSSGGALYNDNGELIGVHVMGAGSWALDVPLSDVRVFLGDAVPHC